MKIKSFQASCSTVPFRKILMYYSYTKTLLCCVCHWKWMEMDLLSKKEKGKTSSFFDFQLLQRVLLLTSLCLKSQYLF